MKTNSKKEYLSTRAVILITVVSTLMFYVVMTIVIGLYCFTTVEPKKPRLITEELKIQNPEDWIKRDSENVIIINFAPQKDEEIIIHLPGEKIEDFFPFDPRDGFLKLYWKTNKGEYTVLSKVSVYICEQTYDKQVGYFITLKFLNGQEVKVRFITATTIKP